MNINLDNNKKILYHSSNNLIRDLKNFLNNNNNNNNNQNELTFYSIDRFINNFAVCENLSTGEFINIPKILIDKNAKTGHVIIKDKQTNKFIIDYKKTEELQNEIKDLARSLFKRKN